MYQRCLSCDHAIETNSGKFCRLFGHPCAEMVACQNTDYPFSAAIKPATTNADRIRSMTDEELAWELCRIQRMPFYKDDSDIDEYEVDCWAKWLKEEACYG